MIAQRGRLPEQLRERRAPHRHRLGGGTRHRDVEGLAVGARIGGGPQAINPRLQIRACQQRNLSPALGAVRQAAPVEAAVATRVVEQRTRLPMLLLAQCLTRHPLRVLHLE